MLVLYRLSLSSWISSSHFSFSKTDDFNAEGTLSKLSIDSAYREFEQRKLNFTQNDEKQSDYQIKFQEETVESNLYY